MSEPRQQTRSDFWPAIALLAASIVLSIILCIPVLNAPLVSDDWVLLDALVRNGIWGAWGGGGHEMLGFFRPLMTLTLWVNMQLGGLNPIGYHLFNAVIHGISAWLVEIVAFMLISKLHGRGGPVKFAASTAWLFFLFHPSHVEPVAWVSSRPDLMACALALGSFAVWMSELKQCIRITLASLLFFLALLAKESVIILPFIILGYEWIIGSQKPDYAVFCRFVRGEVTNTSLRYEPIRRTWPLFLVLVVFLMIRAAALGHVVGGYGSGRILSLNPLFWVRNFAVDVIRSILPAIPSPGFEGKARFTYAAIAIACAMAVTIALALRLMKVDFKNHYGMPTIKFGLLAFLIALVPVINLPVSLRSSEGERFIYLASAFMAIALGTAVGVHIKRFPLFVIFAISLVYFVGFKAEIYVWREAGDLAGKLVRDLDQISRTRPIAEAEIVNLPDHLRGAYVFRNGFVEAAKLNGIVPDRIKSIKIQSVRAIDNVHESFPIGPAQPPPNATIYYSAGSLR